ncbi:pyridoxamine 5'-phosphate oxidase-domain-containing protein [Paraphoma chrysanthemicola]|uniref:Pyridoxamine 5'-phosphate oxidase-domain-containing protein n=1 Tax=Paraphoma chrysanthemicola TaxID=798071 RepID=A0A8K0RBV2_9PLEO|nr:pyridoxamine 5'-phosphate oxidase-domain-containing protein [Paraphoma chrysanthemicola]
MLLTTSLLSLISATSAFNLPSPQRLFTNPSKEDSHAYSIPTVHESAVQARRILRLESIGTLSTVFPTTPHSTEQRPLDVSGAPIGLMDYFGDCEPSTGNPTILAITIATSFKNVDAGSNITLSLRWHPQDSQWRSPASLPRFSLVGRLEDLSPEDVTKNLVPACYIGYHKDAAWWLPGNRIHQSKWVRLVVEEVYWIGGFGDRAYIGWIPLEEWQSVTPEEIESISLPGEKKKGWGGWREWVGMGEAPEVFEL